LSLRRGLKPRPFKATSWSKFLSRLLKHVRSVTLLTMRCDDSRGGQGSLRVALFRGYPQPTDNHESRGVCAGTARSENLWDDPIFDQVQKPGVDYG